MTRNITRRGQEEIVGLVVVVVLIAIVALVLLSFSLRSAPATRESVTITQFVEAISEYTTLCSLSAPPDYASIGELYSACYRGTRCSDGTESCTVLNETLSELITSGLRVGQERPLKGYKFSIAFVENASLAGNGDSTILSLNAGNCTGGKKIGASDFRPAGEGIIRAKLTTCA